jgi:hypothetical protein
MRTREITLRLTLAQRTRLGEACAAYRSYAWQALPPTPERNQTLKGVQAVQGRLAAMQDQTQEAAEMHMDEQEREALRRMLRALMQAWGADVPSPQRTQRLAELAQVRLLIERRGRQARIS